MALSDTVGITQRNLRRMIRTPQLIAFNAVKPVVFVLLFRYLPGGSIKVLGGSYVDCLMPGIFCPGRLVRRRPHGRGWPPT